MVMKRNSSNISLNISLKTFLQLINQTKETLRIEFKHNSSAQALIQALNVQSQALQAKINSIKTSGEP
jgi:hypothetical protein